MSTITIDTFNVIGISVRTTNENGQSASDIPALWNEFITRQIASQIPNKTDNDIYCIYTDYEKDHTKPYTTILGCRVDNLDSVPEGMISKTIEKDRYTQYFAKGNLKQGIVYQAWMNIWESATERTFNADFEIYGEKAQNPEDAEVEICIATK